MVRVSLTGGLGNQLFQLAYALDYAGTNEVILESALAKPRLNSEGFPELLTFELPPQVSLSEKKIINWLNVKIAGYLLRQGIEKKSFERIKMIAATTRFIGAVLLSISFRTPIFPLIAQGVGYFEKKTSHHKNLLIGYFQSHRWASNDVTCQKLRSLKLKNTTILIQKYVELADLENPLVVHIRLGDYKQEDSFGIPTRNYYSRAISLSLETGKYNSIWVFSDEVELAQELFGDLFPAQVRWITEFNDSAATTLEVMRLGKGYIIANSSFSWWGAFLSHSPTSNVICPSPWFIGIDAPKHLVPHTWTMLEYEK